MPWGRKIIVKVRKPIPPMKWVSLRHINNPWSRDSMSWRMVAPLVVYPDIISKKASVKDGIAPESRNGKVDTPQMMLQPNTVTTTASRIVNSRKIGLKNLSGAPNANTISMLIKIGWKSFSS